LNSKPSKSEKKREYLALQALGEQLIGLSREQLDSIALDDRLREAVLVAQSIRSHGALRRQKQLIGKLMRSVDAAPIEDALTSLGRNDHEAKRIFRTAEEWRDRLVRNPDTALAEFVEWSGANDPAVSECVRDLGAAGDDRARKTARRRLFRAIHSQIERKVQNEASSS
jgi:ribosome-associated protein